MGQLPALPASHGVLIDYAFLDSNVCRFLCGYVIAQLLILGLVAAKGNLSSQSITKAIALFNGIDISGVQLQKAFDKSRNVPVPTYDEVLSERAQMNLNLEMRERSIQRFNEQLEAMQAQLKQEQTDFDRRKEAFYGLLDEMSKKGKAENLGEIQRTLEALAPEQAKIYLIKMLELNKRPMWSQSLKACRWINEKRYWESLPARKRFPKFSKLSINSAWANPKLA